MAKKLILITLLITIYLLSFVLADELKTKSEPIYFDKLYPTVKSLHYIDEKEANSYSGYLKENSFEWQIINKTNIIFKYKPRNTLIDDYNNCKLSTSYCNNLIESKLKKEGKNSSYESQLKKELKELDKIPLKYNDIKIHDLDLTKEGTVLITLDNWTDGKLFKLGFGTLVWETETDCLINISANYTDQTIFLNCEITQDNSSIITIINSSIIENSTGGKWNIRGNSTLNSSNTVWNSNFHTSNAIIDINNGSLFAINMTSNLTYKNRHYDINIQNSFGNATLIGSKTKVGKVNNAGYFYCLDTNIADDAICDFGSSSPANGVSYLRNCTITKQMVFGTSNNVTLDGVYVKNAACQGTSDSNGMEFNGNNSRIIALYNNNTISGKIQMGTSLYTYFRGYLSFSNVNALFSVFSGGNSVFKRQFHITIINSTNGPLEYVNISARNSDGVAESSISNASGFAYINVTFKVPSENNLTLNLTYQNVSYLKNIIFAGNDTLTNYTYGLVFMWKDTPFFFNNYTSNVNPEKNTNVSHIISWNSTIASLGGYIFSFDNCSGTFYNDTFVAFTGHSNYSNITKKMPDVAGCTIRWIVFTNNTDNEFKASDVYSYQVNKLLNGCHINISHGSTIYSDTNSSATTSDNVTVLGFCDDNNASLYLDGTLVSNPYSTLYSLGVKTWKVNSTGNTTYEQNASGITTYMTITEPSPPGGGGGGSIDTATIPVIGLLPIQEGTKEYLPLQREIIYASLNNYCSNKIRKEAFAVIDYSDKCTLTLADLDNIQKNLQEFSVDTTIEDLQKFYSLYKTGTSLFQGAESQETINQYSLFTSILGILSPLAFNPPSIDSPVLINNPPPDKSLAIANLPYGSNYTIRSTVLSNKPLASCEPLDNPNVKCEISNSTLKISYFINDTNFLSKIFTVTLAITTDAPVDKVEQKKFTATYRVYNIGYEPIKGIPAYIFALGLIIIPTTGYFIFRKKNKNPITNVKEALRI